MRFELFEYAEMLALITSISCIKYIYKTRYIYFIPYLLMTVLAEATGGYLAKIHEPVVNIEMYNITTSIEFLFFYFLLYKAVNRLIFKRIIYSLSCCFVACTIINQAFIQGFAVFHSYTVLLGTVLIIVFTFFYFYDAFELREPANLIKEPMFWISIGIFLFYLGDFAFNLMYSYLISHNLQSERRLFGMINHNLIVVMYICFSIALILWSKSRLTSKPR